jgi:hypothetical protein
MCNGHGLQDTILVLAKLRPRRSGMISNPIQSNVVLHEKK